MKKNIISVLCVMIGLVLFANVACAADTTPPKTSVNSPANNEIVKGLVGTSCYATDDVKVTKSELYIDNVLKVAGAPSMNIISYTWDSSAATAGSHTIYCKAYDAAGNVTTSVVRAFTLDKSPDTTPPTIMGISPKNGETVSGIYRFSINAMDDYGVISKLTLYMDGKEFISCSNRGDCGRGGVTTGYANGPHTLYSVAIDAAGNVATSPVTSFTMNNLPPTVTITSPANSATVGGNFEIVAIAKGTSDIGSIDFTVNKAPVCHITVLPGNLGPYKCIVDSRTQPNGKSLEIQVEARDANGTPGYSPITKVTVYNDVSNWEVKIISPTDGAKLSGIVPIQTFSTNSSMTSLYVDGKNVTNVGCASCGFKWNSATVADGVHTMYIDTYWNGSFYSSPIIAIATNNGKPDPGDTINPTVSLTYPAPNYVLKGTEATLIATASDNTGIFKVEFYDGNKLLGSDPTEPYNYKWTISAADNGPHSIIAKAYDMKGNIGVSAALPLTVNISGGSDTAKPTVSITAPTNNASYTSAQAVAINATASDNVGVSKVEFYDGSILLGADTTSPYSYNWAITATDNGAHSLTAKAYDVAGNSTVSFAISTTVNIVVSDTTAPTVSLTSPKANINYTSGQTVTLAATTSDNIGVTKVEFYDGATLLGTDTALPYSYGWTIAAANNGSHSLTAKAYDVTGNSKVSAIVNVTVNIATGCTSNAACDDGIYCNGAETCQSGKCVKGTAVTCNDSNACTADTCSESAKACSYVPLADNTSCASGVCCAGTCKAGAATCAGTGTVCWNGSNQNLYLGTALLNKFCKCAQGTYSYKAYKLNPGNNVSWYYIGAVNTENWAVKSVSSGLSVSSVTCSDGKVYPTNQTYTYPVAVSVASLNIVTSDAVNPTVLITSPRNNISLMGSLDINVDAYDAVGISKVEIYADNVLKGTDMSAPYSFEWDTPWELADGTHILTAKAYNTVGNSAISPAITLTVKNGVDVTPPVVEITAPTNNSAVKGSIYILGSAQDTAALPKVDLYLDNVLMAKNTIMFEWNSALVANGIHTWTAKAYDAAGNTTISAPVSVKVNNG